MYCKHCGKELREKALSCDHCGFTKGNGAGFCPHCGRRVAYQQETCEYCGGVVFSLYHKKSRHRVVAGLLALLFGYLGLHNFYMGYWTRGLLKLIFSAILFLLSIGAMILLVWAWAWIEGINILRRETRVDAHGRFLKG